jgi:hypothetical protein
LISHTSSEQFSTSLRDALFRMINVAGLCLDHWMILACSSRYIAEVDQCIPMARTAMPCSLSISHHLGVSTARFPF